MQTLFGKPVVPVPQPGGELTGYLIEGVTPDPADRALRRWTLTSPGGGVYTVSEYPTHWACDCPAATRYTRRGCSRVVGRQKVCKHCFALAVLVGVVNGTHGQEGRAGTGQRVADPAGGGDDP